MNNDNRTPIEVHGPTLITFWQQRVDIELDDIEVSISADAGNASDGMAFMVEPEQDEAVVDLEMTLEEVCKQIIDDGAGEPAVDILVYLLKQKGPATTADAQPASTPTTRETVSALLADDDSRVMLLGLLAEAGYSVAKRGGAA